MSYDNFRNRKREARQQAFNDLHRAIGTTKVAGMAAAAKGSDRTHGLLKSQTTGPEAVMFVRSFMDNFRVPSKLKLSYMGIKNAMHRTGSQEIESGVVTVHAEMETGIGHRIHFDIPVVIHNGEMMDPSIMVTQLGPRVIAQSAIDELVSTHTAHYVPQFREMYDPPRGPTTDTPFEVERRNRGMFASAEAQDQLRRILQGKTVKPPKIPKPPPTVKPSSPKGTKPDTKRPCARCHQAPCVCPGKKKVKGGIGDAIVRMNMPVDRSRPDNQVKAPPEATFMASLKGKPYKELSELYMKLNQELSQSGLDACSNRTNPDWLRKQQQAYANLVGLGKLMRNIINQNKLQTIQDVTKSGQKHDLLDLVVKEIGEMKHLGFSEIDIRLAVRRKYPEVADAALGQSGAE